MNRLNGRMEARIASTRMEALQKLDLHHKNESPKHIFKIYDMKICLMVTFRMLESLNKTCI